MQFLEPVTPVRILHRSLLGAGWRTPRFVLLVLGINKVLEIGLFDHHLKGNDIELENETLDGKSNQGI
jgi:hypothetical protein